MSKYKITCFATALLALTVVAFYADARESHPMPQQERKTAELRPDDPHYLLWTRGYPKATSLVQAVDEFNKRAQRTGVGKTQPPLTVDEVLAAIRDWSPKEDPIELPIFEGLQQAAKSGMLPKGAYLRFNSGAYSRNGYDIDAWNVYLQVGLDKYHADLVGVPAYGVLIRRQYIASRPEEFLNKRGKW